MAASLKERIGPPVVEALARSFSDVSADFNRRRFEDAALRGLSSLELMQRAEHIALALDAELPAGDAALEQMVATLDAPLKEGEVGGLQHFVHSSWLLRRTCTDDFDTVMWAAEELTRRFTSEFVVRPMIERDPERALAWLYSWHLDDDAHVRRLVSEGTRPRLPWAPRLTVFREATAPIAELLDALVDDPSLYVRRSVANHVGDLAKDDLPVALELCRAWQRRGSEEVSWVVRHALRHPLKKGVPEVLALFGHGEDPAWLIEGAVKPQRARRGGAVSIEVTLHNPHREVRTALVDLVVHYRKANGSDSPKVFKLKTVQLEPGAQLRIVKNLKLGDLSTRRHHPGEHRVDVQVNGRAHAVGAFDLV